jgi:hypothetical protein
MRVMSPPLPFAGNESTANSPPDGSANAEAHSVPLYSYDDLVRFGWPPIGRGIIMAGGAYPLVVAGGYLFALFCVMLLNGFDGYMFHMDWLESLLIGAPMFAIVAGIVGVTWASMVTVVTLPVVHLVVWSLQLRMRPVWLGAFSGGLIGFVSVLPITLQLPYMLNTSQGWEAAVMLLCGPCLTTVLGQIGGALGGRRAVNRLAAKMEMRRSLLAVGWRRPTTAEETTDVESTIDTSHPRFRFRTAHLLWVGVWLSLLLTVIRLSGIAYELILPVLLGWLVYQTITLATGRLLVQQLGPWWRSRQIRST